jgi:hypothetical protein
MANASVFFAGYKIFLKVIRSLEQFATENGLPEDVLI